MHVQPDGESCLPVKAEVTSGRLQITVPATLAEIAGPGIQLVCPLHASVDDRVLVVIELNARRSVESVGVVRRVGTGANGAPFLGIELIGLSTEQVADLARETNRQARHPAEEAVALSAGA